MVVATTLPTRKRGSVAYLTSQVAPDGPMVFFSPADSPADLNFVNQIRTLSKTDHVAAGYSALLCQHMTVTERSLERPPKVAIAEW